MRTPLSRYSEADRRARFLIIRLNRAGSNWEGTTCVFFGLLLGRPLDTSSSSGGCQISQGLSLTTSLSKTASMPGRSKRMLELRVGLKWTRRFLLLRSMSLSFQSSTLRITLAREAESIDECPPQKYLVAFLTNKCISGLLRGRWIFHMGNREKRLC